MSSTQKGKGKRLPSPDFDSSDTSRPATRHNRRDTSSRTGAISNGTDESENVQSPEVKVEELNWNDIPSVVKQEEPVVRLAQEMTLLRERVERIEAAINRQIAPLLNQLVPGDLITPDPVPSAQKTGERTLSSISGHRSGSVPPPHDPVTAACSQAPEPDRAEHTVNTHMLDNGNASGAGHQPTDGVAIESAELLRVKRELERLQAAHATLTEEKKQILAARDTAAAQWEQERAELAKTSERLKIIQPPPDTRADIEAWIEIERSKIKSLERLLLDRFEYHTALKYDPLPSTYESRYELCFSASAHLAHRLFAANLRLKAGLNYPEITRLLELFVLGGEVPSLIDCEDAASWPSDIIKYRRDYDNVLYTIYRDSSLATMALSSLCTTFNLDFRHERPHGLPLLSCAQSEQLYRVLQNVEHPQYGTVFDDDYREHVFIPRKSPCPPPGDWQILRMHFGEAVERYGIKAVYLPTEGEDRTLLEDPDADDHEECELQQFAVPPK